MEGGIWQAILADAGGSDIPRTDGEFLSFAKSLPDDTMYDILKSSTPVSNISVYQAMRNEKILYNQMDIPSGVLPLGDSAQRLNPIYGQVGSRWQNNIHPYLHIASCIICRESQLQHKAPWFYLNVWPKR